MSAFNPTTMSAAGASAPIAVTPSSTSFAQTFNLGLLCTVSPGAALTYSVQVTGDPAPSAAGHWNEHDVLTNLIGSANSNIVYPVTGVRLNVLNHTSGTVTLAIVRWP